MASAAVSFMVKTLGTLIQDEVVLLWGVEEDLKTLSSTLSTILAVLDDAEVKQYKDKAIQVWLRKLKDATYVVGDILDECETEALKREIKLQGSGRLKKVWTSAITCYPAVNLYFRHQIGNRMKDIIKHLNAIAEERTKFSIPLIEGLIGQGLALDDDRRETSSFLPPLELFGRRDEREKIVKVLTKEVCDIEGFSVYPIIGIGGLGKTTLAQMAFNDERINSYFEPKIWVYVSQNFNVKQLLKQIIESTSGEECKATSLDPLQKEVQKRLSGKRYLLVLDDAWSENEEEWDNLKPALACGLHGSSVVVTTRSEKVASIIGTLSTHHLSPLSRDDCWLLFRQRAFGPGNEELPDLVDIGKEIVKKCAGVPLVAKALGGMLRYKRGEKEWISVNESNLWDIPEEECSILPALRLSYYSLSLELRRCFSYCAVFLKGSKIKKDKLIQLWMANGYISSKNKIEVEDVGNHIWNELYMRSFFQDKENDIDGNIYFGMHDLMHDLTMFVMGDECQLKEAQTSGSVLMQRIRHLTLDLEERSYPRFRMVERTDRVFNETVYSWGKILVSLRVIDVGGSNMYKFAGSDGYSKHLRYLNLSETGTEKIPESICGLLNLQTLNLNGCWMLRMLPKKMNKLVGLRHLYLLDCLRLEDTPAELGKLTQLKTLSLFVVGEKNGRRLGELKNLDLGGEIKIENLERVMNSMDANEAYMAGKPNIRTLTLSWQYYWEHSIGLQENLTISQVIEALVPHPNIERLTINNYRGNELPLWMGNPSILKNVVRIELNHCSHCTCLPAIGQLPCLKALYIARMTKLGCLAVSQNGNKFTCDDDGGDSHNIVTSAVGGFPSLEILSIRYLPNLKVIVSMDKEEEDEGDKQEQWRRQQEKLLLLPRLKTFVIDDCPQLTLPTLDTLESLSICGSINENIVNVISKLTGLTGLHLDGDLDGGDLVCFPDEMFLSLTRLQTLKISRFPELKTLPETVSSLVALKELSIEFCAELECLPDDGIRSLTSVLKISISDCPKLACLPDSLQTLTQLQTLFLYDNSPELERQCEKGSGEDWYKIAHIPNIINKYHI